VSLIYQCSQPLLRKSSQIEYKTASNDVFLLFSVGFTVFLDPGKKKPSLNLKKEVFDDDKT